MPYLTQEQIGELVTAVIALPLNYSQVRPVFMSGIDQNYIALLNAGLPPKPQVMMDLTDFNQVPRLAGGQVPLRIWLANAALLAAATEQEKIFQRHLDDVSHQASGAPRINISDLPEAKEKIIHVDDMVRFVFMEAGLMAANSVARLSVPRYDNGQPRKLINGQPMIYLGTGWLLTPELLVTNHHVINARNENESAASEADLQLQGTATVVKFDFNADGMQGTDSTVGVLEAWAPDPLDYALLRLPVTQRPGLSRSAKPLGMKTNDYIPVNIIQHPEGGSKKFAIRNNLVTATTATDIRYFTDTKDGSSGSPVFNDQWQVVGLHRGATLAENVSFQGRNVAWVNVGTQLSAILADLQQRYPALAAGL